MRQEFQQAMDDFSHEVLIDAIGLWQISKRVRRIAHPQTEDELRQLVLEFVKEMLARGFEAADLIPSGKSLPWRDQDPASVLHRIDSEWKALGREPNVGEVAWFDHRSSS